MGHFFLHHTMGPAGQKLSRESGLNKDIQADFVRNVTIIRHTRVPAFCIFTGLYNIGGPIMSAYKSVGRGKSRRVALCDAQ